LGLWNDIAAVVFNPRDIAPTLLEILARIQQTNHALFGTLMWSIWKNRNNKIWNDISDTCQTICDRATTFLASWMNAQEVKAAATANTARPQIETWLKPSEGRYKCNVDAAFSENMDRVGIGICIRDMNGAFVLARTDCFSPIIDVDTGEALGLLQAMEWVRDLHLVNMDFEVDSKTVADNIYRTQSGVSEFSVLISNCIHLLGTDLMNSDVKFIRRQANGVAHSLAKAALSEASFRIHYNIPSCIEPLIVYEMH
jgi:ribonuclease HI